MNDAAAFRAIGNTGDPFSVLGPHDGTLSVLLPGATGVQALTADGTITLTPVGSDGLFEGPLTPRTPYRLRIDWDGIIQITEDPYAFGLLLSSIDLHLIAEGRHRELGRCLGAHALSIDGVEGVRFAVWAPNARRVSVVGDFNAWDGRRHAMRHRIEAGVWEIFVPRLPPGALYKYEVVGLDGAYLPLKADPIGGQAERRPGTASIVVSPEPFRWRDAEWLQRRSCTQSRNAPLSVYEVHAPSWIRIEGHVPDWDQLAERLVPYAAEMGFTHLELMPIMAHPFGGSWGYQPLGQFAPMPELGLPHAFARFVDRCHAADLGVILDWVPAHFPDDAHGLARFDGTALYEHADPREGFHRDWDTLIYNFGRDEVRGFLIASALHWLEHFHVDGLRVDAVASMLYRDYSRTAGEWIPNIYGGRENLEAVSFLRELCDTVAQRCPGTLLIAEESTAWPGVTAAPSRGGLGFTHKWNMGWMHDTLRYMQHEPVHRAYHHDDMTFALIYAYSETFILPLSHDEVVYGKGSLLGRMPGDTWQRFANLRAYLGFMWGHPGGKTLFMGGEFAQSREWNHDASLDWHLLDDPLHRGVQRLVQDLNTLYRTIPALHAADHDTKGFDWIISDDRAQSVFAFLRQHGSAPVLVISNFTPVARHGYRVGVPLAGLWQECLNSDAAAYGGSNIGNAGLVMATAEPAHGQPASMVLTLPPQSTIFLRRQEES